jgi:hypothetical protein
LKKVSVNDVGIWGRDDGEGGEGPPKDIYLKEADSKRNPFEF